MFEYLEKFNLLPKEIRDKVSSPAVISNIEAIEKEFGLDLAVLVMKIMIKEIDLENCRPYLIKEFNLSDINSQKLIWRLKEKVFKDVKNYLNIKTADSEIKIFSNFDPSFPNRRMEDENIDIVSNQYLFSPEDEEEIRALTKKINGYNRDNSGLSLADKAEMIVKQININFGSRQLEQRFKDIVFTYIKGVRDKIDTRLTLKRSFESGGLNFDDDSINNVFKVIDNFQEKDANQPILIKPKIQVPEDNAQFEKLKNIGVRDVEFDLKKTLESRQNNLTTPEPEIFQPVSANKPAQKKSEPIFQKLDVSHELAPPTPKLIPRAPLAKVLPKVASQAINKPVASSSAVSQTIVPPPSDSPKIKQISIFGRQAKRENAYNKEKVEAPIIMPRLNIPTDLSGKKIIKDVSAVPRVMNPIDELKYLDLVSFRRMGANINEITGKIFSKIKLLEEERYGRRIEGIKAWRNSPVYRLYLNIGQESISKNMPVSDIIENRKNSNKDYLSSEEFEGVMDLNKSLRF